jgi:hypothetical protein
MVSEAERKRLAARNEVEKKVQDVADLEFENVGSTLDERTTKRNAGSGSTW